MDVNNLSSNWKKLQETLKKQSASSSSKKRKTSDRETQNVTTKKQKIETIETIERKKSSLKKKRMSEGQEHGGDESAQEPMVKTISHKSSTATISEQSRTESKPTKVNEGRSPTLVIPIQYIQPASSDPSSVQK